MADDIIRFKVGKDGYTAELQLPSNFILENEIDLEQIVPVFSKLYKALDIQIRDVQNEKSKTPSNTPRPKSDTLLEQPMGDSVKKNQFDPDDPTKSKPLEEVIKNSSNWREVELLLIIIYYASDFGRVDVTRDDIIDMYKENGKESVSRKRNLTNNIQTLIKYKWISSSSEGYHMTDEGNFRAKGIIAREKNEDIPT